MVRLRLVQGVVAYHLGRDKEARLLLEKVTSKLQLLAVDEAGTGSWWWTTSSGGGRRGPRWPGR